MNRLQRNIPHLFDNIGKYKPFTENVVIWLGLRAADYSMINFMDPNIIMSTRYGKDDIFLEQKFPLISTEKNTKKRTDSSLDELDFYLDDTLKFLSSLKDISSFLICYHSTPVIEKKVAQYPNIKILNPPSYLKNYLDKKTVVREHLKNLGIPMVPGLEGKLCKDTFEFSAKKYGLPLFIQFDDSASGSGSHIVENAPQFNELYDENKNQQAIFMKYIEGKSLNINAVKTRNFVILSEPSLQIIGQPECTTRKFGYCGNDFNVSSKLSDEQFKEISNITKKIGDWMGLINYLGVFGIDFMVDNEKVYFIEINPRFQGSTSLLIDRQMELGKVPLSLFHIVPFMDNIYIDPNSVEDYNHFNAPLNVSQLLLHNISNKDATIESQLNPGRYKFEDDKLIYLGPAQFLSQTKSYNEILIAGDIPLNGTTVLKDSDEICRVYSYKEVLDKNGINLNAFGKDLVKNIYSSFNLK